MRDLLPLWMIALCCLADGCGKSARTPVYPVTGKLTVNGEPVANVNLAFHPSNPKDKKRVCPVAITETDGSFHLTTYANGDGAPAGEYSVSVLWLVYPEGFDECECENVLLHDRFRGSYADPRQSPLHVTVRAKHNQIALSTVAPDDPPADATEVENRRSKSRPHRSVFAIEP